MDNLMLGPTSLAQWQGLVVHAQESAHCTLPHEQESYLVFLLMRFAVRADIAAKVLALDYLRSMQHTGRLRQDALQEVGDCCLLFAGLFPSRARRRRVSIGYFVDLGRSSYQQLAACLSAGSAPTFTGLAENFVRLMDVLQTMRAGADQPVDLLAAYEQWNETGSQVATRTLQQHTDSIILPTPVGQKPRLS